MPLPLTTVFLVGGLGAAVLGFATVFWTFFVIALVIEFGLFLIGGFGGLGEP